MEGRKHSPMLWVAEAQAPLLLLADAASPVVVGSNEVHPLSIRTLFEYLFYFWKRKTFFTPLRFEEKCWTLNSLSFDFELHFLAGCRHLLLSS